jgi:hypothetical protein
VEEQLGRAVATVIRGEVGKIDSNVRLIAEKYCELDGVKK